MATPQNTQKIGVMAQMGGPSAIGSLESPSSRVGPDVDRRRRGAHQGGAFGRASGGAADLSTSGRCWPRGCRVRPLVTRESGSSAPPGLTVLAGLSLPPGLRQWGIRERSARKRGTGCADPFDLVWHCLAVGVATDGAASSGIRRGRRCHSALLLSSEGVPYISRG